MSADHVIDADMQELREQISALTAERDKALAESRFHWLERDSSWLERDDARAERDRLRSALEAVEWAGRAMNGNTACGNCGRRKLAGHAPDCIVGLTLKAKS